MSERDWEIWDKQRVEYYIKRYGHPERQDEQHRLRMRKAAELVEGDTVLDVGCGIGHLYPYVRAKVKEYVGIDNSEAMLAAAKAFYPDIEFTYGDIYNLDDFKTFDSVICQSVLIHLPEIKTPIKEMWKHTAKTLIFSIPIASQQVIKNADRYKGKRQIYHAETISNIQAIIDELDDVASVERHEAQKNTSSNIYFKLIRG